MKITTVSALLLAVLLTVSAAACPTFSRAPNGILTGGYSFFSRGNTLVILGNGKVQTKMEVVVQRPNEQPRTYTAGSIFAVWNGVTVLTPGYVMFRIIE